MQDNWKLSEGFVAEEAKVLLPHRATGRYILFNNLCQSAWLHCKSSMSQLWNPKMMRILFLLAVELTDKLLPNGKSASPLHSI